MNRRPVSQGEVRSVLAGAYHPTVLLLFPLAACLIRLAISPSMISDESEQYLESGEFRLGYSNQPPLFNWAVFAVSRITGMGLFPIVAVKYLCLSLFFVGLYLAARRFAPAPEALTAAASALIIPQYSFKIIEDLTHTVMMVAVVSFCMWAFLLVLERRRTGSYVLLGVLLGLGMLSKYNFVFFAAAAMLACLLSQKSRRAVLHPKFLIAIAAALLVFSPHAGWLLRGDAETFAYIVRRGDFGGLGPSDIVGTLVSSYWGGVLYVGVFALFLGNPVCDGGVTELHGFVRRTCVLALVLPLAVIVVGQTGLFRAKWLSSSLLCIPLALATMALGLSSRRRRRRFNAFLIVLGMSILLARAVPGFFPDSVRSHGRELIPYQALALRIEESLKDRGWAPQEVLLVADGTMTAANIIRESRMDTYVILEENRPLNSDQRRLLAESLRVVLVWNTREGKKEFPDLFRQFVPNAEVLPPLREHYVRSETKDFVLGIAIAERTEPVTRGHGAGVPDKVPLSGSQPG